MASQVKTGKGKLILGNIEEASSGLGVGTPDYVQAMMLMAELGRGEDFVIGTRQLALCPRVCPDCLSRRWHWRTETEPLTTDARLMRSVDAPELCGNASKAERLLRAGNLG